MWAWSYQLYLSNYNKRSLRRNELALKALFKSSVWVFRVLICEHGGAWRCQLCLSKCSKRNHRRQSLVVKYLSTSNIWVPRWQWNWTLKPYLSKCSRRNHRRSQLVSRGCSKSSVCMTGSLVYGPGAHMLCSGWCGKRHKWRSESMNLH